MNWLILASEAATKFLFFFTKQKEHPQFPTRSCLSADLLQQQQ
jgi:hypothetical protein